jgi:serine protease Do
MKKPNRMQLIFLVAGLAVLFGVGKMFLPAHSGIDPALQPVPIDPATVAPAVQLGKAYAMVAAHVKPSVVSVYSERTIKFTHPEFPSPFGGDFFRHFFGQDMPPLPGWPSRKEHEYNVPQRGMGSGMILDKEGHILTNYHVVQGENRLHVQLADKINFEAEVVGTDPKTDVAIIKIKGHIPEDLPAITLGDSDAQHVGDLVIAIGAPFGLQQTVTEGIISATGRSNVGIADYEDFIQTDAPINPGNSGGPLVNMNGEVIGMNSAIATNGASQFAGVGFSIPSNMIKTMLPTLLKGETIVRGQLGVVIQEITPELAKSFGLPQAKGVLLAQINKDSPAEKAGLKVGDVIVRYDDKVVQGVRELRNMVSATLPGTRVKLQIIRNGKEESLTVTVGQQGENAILAGAAPAQGITLLSKLGLEVQTLTPTLAQQLGVEGKRGVAITNVREGSLASLAGLQKGDVITEADRQPVNDVDDLDRALTKAKDQDNVLLLIARRNESLFVELQMK